MLATVRRFGIVPIFKYSRNILGADDTVPAITPAQAWTQLNADCMDMLKSEDACRGLLGTQALYFAPEERPKIPSWAYLLLGITGGFMAANLLVAEKVRT